MQGKHVKSTDPAKKSIVQAFKLLYNCNKVTLVRQIDERTFEADCLRGGKGRGAYENLGRFRIIKDDANAFNPSTIVDYTRASLPSDKTS